MSSHLPDPDRPVPVPERAFSLPRDLRYLNCAYMGPLPRAAEAAGIRGIRRKRDPSRTGPDDFFRESQAVKEAFAGLLGVDAPGRIAILPSVSYGIAITARNAGLRAGQKVLLTRDQFPGNVYGWLRVAREVGARVEFVDPPASGSRGEGWNRRILESLDRDTRVVSLGHVHWTDGTLFRLGEIGARAREVGALLVVDGTQSVGALPLDMTAVRPDAVVVAGYKWLLGPYSLALGYFGEAFDGGVPLEEGWIVREGSDDFGGLVHYREEYLPQAGRYDVGERSNFILLPMALASLRLLLEWTPQRIQDHCEGIASDFLSWAGEWGLRVDDSGWRARHLFGVRWGSDGDGYRQLRDPERLRQALKRRSVVVSQRGDALRISPHLYNDSGDLAYLREALEEGVSGGP